MGYIYRIVNKINGKQYIGQSEQDDINDRWRGHIYCINNDKGCPLLTDAFRKHGLDNFRFEVIVICFDEDRYRFEKEYIKLYNTMAPNGYNLTEGGEPGGNFKGKTHTEEVRNILREKATAWNNNPENKSRLGQLVRIGLLNSEKWKKAKEEGRIGTHDYNKQPKSKEVKEKISESLKKFFSNKDNLAKCKTKKPRNGRPVYQCTLENTIIKQFINAAEAARQVQLNRKSIQANLAGRSNTAGGYIWKYADLEFAQKELKDNSLSSN
jgi:group I intron endonuclease